MERLFPSSPIQRFAWAWRKVPAKRAGRGSEFPKADIQFPKSSEVTQCDRRRRGREHQERPICEEAISGRLHKAFAPVFELCLNRGELEPFKGKSREILARSVSPPRHEDQVCPTESLERELAPCSMPLTATANLRLQVQVMFLKAGEKIRFPAFSRRVRRKIATGVVATKSDAKRRTGQRSRHEAEEPVGNGQLRTRFRTVQAQICS